MGSKTYRLMPALDIMDLEQAVALAKAVGDLDFILGFKIGFTLGLTHGLPETVKRLRGVTDKALVYDHQKAGTDIPATGEQFADIMAGAGIDQAILFPQAGPVTNRAWIKGLVSRGVGVISGGLMTHPGYILSEGGYIGDDRVGAMYGLAREEGVTSFVVPLTRAAATRALFPGDNRGLTFYSPGFGAQGGDPAGFDFIQDHCLIVGRSLLASADPRGWVEQVQTGLEA